MDREEHKRKLTRERVRNHRERKAEMETEHQYLLAQYGAERIKKFYTANGIAEYASGLLMLFKNEPQTSTNISPEEVPEVILAIDEWSQTYEPDDALHDNWQRGMQMGFWTEPNAAAAYFKAKFDQYRHTSQQ